MKYNRMSRRMFLQGAGTMLPIPFLASMVPRELWAQSNNMKVPRRYIVFTSYFDYGRHEHWFPNLAQPMFSLNPGNGDQTLRYAPLRSYLTSSTAPLSRVFGNQLNAHLDSINLIRGLDQSTRIAHGQGHILGNIRDTDLHEAMVEGLSRMRTIDQVLRDHPGFNDINKDVAVVGFPLSCSYRRGANGQISNVPVSAKSPLELYNYLFNSGRLPETSGNQVITPHNRYSQLNAVMEDYRRVKGGKQISASDRQVLDNALDKISDVLKTLGGTTVPAGSCQHKNVASNSYTQNRFWDHEPTMRSFADMITAGIMCDVTRIFVVNMYPNEAFYDKHPVEGFHNGHSHTPWDVVNGKVNHEYMAEIQNDFVRNLLSRFINNLAGSIDPVNGKTYLYNSLVHYTLESSQLHGMNSSPAFLAGNAGGRLNTGYYLDYTDRSRPHTWVADGFSTSTSSPQFAHEYVGIPYNRLFNTILQVMGLTPADYEDNSINTHFENRNDGRYGAINNGIVKMGGYGHWGPPTSTYTDRYMRRQALYNLHFFKNPLVLPANSAG